MNVAPDVRIGIWHYIPIPLEYKFERDSKRSLKEHFEAYFKEYDNRPIIIYAHGNDRDRSTHSRIEISKNLNQLGYHVFAIDYRGYGDSTGFPSEIGLVEDLILFHNFIKAFQNQSRIYLWGHSLGTGYATCSIFLLYT
jgi:abhydrolase domain-containing protein 12